MPTEPFKFNKNHGYDDEKLTALIDACKDMWENIKD
jgi:hypothetical protein